jgi:hypothetical protein
MLVNHQDKKIIFNGTLTNVEKGSCITSLRKLSERWGWSISKTKRFFEQLQNEKMLSFKSDTKKTLVTIENWDLYQCSETEIVTPKENKSKTEEKQKETNKNDKNDKNEKKEYIDLKFVDEIIEKVKLTQEQYNKLINKYDKEYVHKEILGLDNYIVNGKGDKYKDHYRTLNTWLRTRKAPAPKEERHYGFNG